MGSLEAHPPQVRLGEVPRCRPKASCSARGPTPAARATSLTVSGWSAWASMKVTARRTTAGATHPGPLPARAVIVVLGKVTKAVAATSSANAAANSGLDPAALLEASWDCAKAVTCSHPRRRPSFKGVCPSKRRSPAPPARRPRTDIVVGRSAATRSSTASGRRTVLSVRASKRATRWSVVENRNTPPGARGTSSRPLVYWQVPQIPPVGRGGAHPHRGAQLVGPHLAGRRRAQVAGEVGGVPAEADRPFRGVHLSQRGVGDTRLTGVELEDVNGHGPTSTGGRAASAGFGPACLHIEPRR